MSAGAAGPLPPSQHRLEPSMLLARIALGVDEVPGSGPELGIELAAEGAAAAVAMARQRRRESLPA